MRNAEFDQEKVLRSAMNAFMHKGFAKTSMQDLTKATGLHPGSIYCAFENKRGLLIAALGQYRDDRNTEFDTFFSGKAPVLAKFKAYLDHIVKECISGDSAQACLLTKALNEVAEQDEEIQTLISENLRLWQVGIAEQFELAKSNKELKTKKDSGHLARYFVMGIYGLRVFAQTRLEAAILEQLADQLYQDIFAE